MTLKRALAVLAVLVFCFVAPPRSQAGDEFNLVDSLIQYTARFRNGETAQRETVTQCRPGQLIFVQYSTGYCGCPGWSTLGTVTVSDEATVDVEDVPQFYPTATQSGQTITLGGPDFGGFSPQVFIRVKPVEELRSSEITVTSNVTMSDDCGRSRTRQLTVKIPIVGLPLSLVGETETQQASVVKEDEEFTYRLTATPGEFVSRMTVRAKLPNKKLATYVAGSASPPATRRGDTLEWRFDNVSTSQQMSIRLRSAKSFPKNATKIPLAAAADTSAGDQRDTQDDVRIASPFVVFGTIRDAVMDFPNRTFIKLKKPKGAQIDVSLRKKGTGEVVDTAQADRRGDFDLAATEAGDYEVRIETPGDRYDESSEDVLSGDATLVQTRDVTIADDATEPTDVGQVILPISLAADVAARLKRVNNLQLRLAGFIPLPTSLDTGALVPAVDALLASTDEEFSDIFDGTGDRDGWNALIRMNLVLSLVEARFADNAKLADIFSKSVALIVTLEIVKKIGPKVVDRWKQSRGLGPSEWVPADMKSRTVEAVKIATLAYGVGYILPKLLNQTDLSGTQKSLIIEVVAKAVRFGLNSFVPAQNAQDVVFEVIFQALRTGLFAGFNEVLFVRNAENELSRATGLFQNRVFAEDTTATMQWLEAYDAKVSDRSRENFRISADALSKLSLFVRGLDGVLFKSSQAMGYSSANASNTRALKKNLDKVLGKLKKPKEAATITAFALAVAAPIAEQIYVFQDLETEVSVAFSGPAGLGDPVPPGLGLASGIGRGFSDFFSGLFGTRSSGSGKRGNKQPEPPDTTPITEVADYLAALDDLDDVLAGDDTAAYPSVRTSLLVAHDGLFARLRLAMGRAQSVLRDHGDADDVLVGLQGATYELGSTIGLAYVQLEAWAGDDDRKSRKSTRKRTQQVLADLRYELAFLTDALVDSEAELAGYEVPETLTITGGPDGLDLPASSTLAFTFDLTNIGTVTGGDVTVTLDLGEGLTSAGPTEIVVAALNGGASTMLSFDVTTPADRSMRSYTVTAVLADGTTVVDQGIVYIEP